MKVGISCAVPWADSNEWLQSDIFSCLAKKEGVVVKISILSKICKIKGKKSVAVVGGVEARCQVVGSVPKMKGQIITLKESEGRLIV